MDYPLRLVSQLRAHLQALRRQRSLTQAQLGARLGLSQVRIAEIEANPGVVSVDQLARILSALGAMLVLRDLAADPPQPLATPPQAAAQLARTARGATAQGARTASSSAKKPSARTRLAPTTGVPTLKPTLKPKKGSW